MLVSCLLGFTDSSGTDARPHIAEIYRIFSASTDVQALGNLVALYASEDVAVSYARVPMLVRGTVACFARYFTKFSLLASLVEMGRATSVSLFCVAMGPWYHHVHQKPRVLVNHSYMDGNATGGQGLRWLPYAEALIQSFSTADFITTQLNHMSLVLIPSHTLVLALQ